jgi:hypothetical protein
MIDSIDDQDGEITIEELAAVVRPRTRARRVISYELPVSARSLVD